MRLRMHRRARGQALTEFALGIFIMVVIVIMTLDFLPIISARGSVLEAASSASERASAFLAPPGQAGAQRTLLCNMLLEATRSQLEAAGLPTNGGGRDAYGRPTDGCRTMGQLSANQNPVVDARLLRGDDFIWDRMTASDQPEIEICLAYRWEPAGGIWWILGGVTQTVFTFNYCGRSEIDAYRTR